MLIPSIDLQGGRVVQLVQGERLAWSSEDLDGWIERFSRFPVVQVIDLDAAKGTGSNRELVRRICERLPCQVGGGIRSVADALALVDAGARRVIVGSALFANGGVDVEAAERFSVALGRERLIAAVDSRGGKVAVRGWQETINLQTKDAMAPLEPWVGAFLATLIDGEGRLGGIDVAAAEALRRATDRQLIVAGGVRSMAEVNQLHALGMDAVVGMAIYTGVIDVGAGLAPGPRDPWTPTSVAVIFDFDGVIADSEGQHFLAFQQAFAERGWPLSESDYYESYLGFSDREVFQVVAGRRGEQLTPADLDHLMAFKGRAYADLVGRGALLCDGAERAIRRLADHFPLAIASSAFRHEIVDVLEAAALRSFFSAVVGAEDVPLSKPSPAPYLEAARLLALNPEGCVAIEDSPWGLESARAAGLRTIGITHTYPPDRLTSADVIVKSLDEISEGFVRELARSRRG